jgi:cell shape-determining protein MreC
MFDRKSRVMLLLALLNEAYGDVRSIVAYLEDFIASHPEMSEEIEEFKLRELVEEAVSLEKKILEVMEEMKREIYG